VREKIVRKKYFTPEDPALPMSYPGFVLRTLLQDGYRLDDLIEGTGLKEKQLNDPNFRCGFQPLRRLLSNCIAQTADPHLGARLALRFQPNFIGLPSYTAMNAANFEDGLEVLSKFFYLNFPAFELSILKKTSCLKTGEAALRLRSKFPFHEIEYFGFSSAIVAINGLLKVMLQADEVATRAEMTVKRPENFAQIEAELGFRFGFDASENKIIFPANLMGRQLPGSDPLNHARLLGLCEHLAEEMSFETTPVAQVLAILEDKSSLSASLSDVAAELGYSERGLRRQLARSGTSYLNLVNQVRERRARSLLANSTTPIKAIADALGFGSPSNFARSFKRWTGVSPKAFRDRVQTLPPSEAGRKRISSGRK
jgi:AraC-like DNA-binding protein